jgi:pimeloyl-ACP methyl ester carboxylesterase
VARQIESVFAPQAAPDGYADYFGVGLTLRSSALKANAQHRAALPQEIVTLSQNYDRISVPIELLHGTADETVHIDIHSRQLRAHPCAHLVELPGVGHMPHHADPQITVAALRRLAKRACLQVDTDQRIVTESVRSSHDQTV